jgi:hypothetical protein
MTLTFDLDLDTDLAKRCLSYVSIIILSIINNDWTGLFIWFFKVLQLKRRWPWPWPCKTMPLICIYHYIMYHQQGLTHSFYMNFLSFGPNLAAVTLTFKISQKLKKGLANVPLYPPTKFHSNISSRFWETGAWRTHARTHARTAVHEWK